MSNDPRHSAQPLDFGQVYEGLFVRGLRGRLTLQPAYPSSVLPACIVLTAQTLYPTEPLEQALKVIGRTFFLGFIDTLLGRAMLGLLRIIGPRRSLERMQRNFRTGSNYIETRFLSLARPRPHRAVVQHDQRHSFILSAHHRTGRRADRREGHHRDPPR